MRFKPSRRQIGTAGLAFGLVLGGAGISAATTGNMPGTDTKDAPDTAYTSSVTVPSGTKPDGLAKVTPEQAATVAGTAANGIAGQAVLENEHGNVVYTVEVTQPGGAKVDVAIDAGNAKVLSQEAGDNETNDGRTDGQGNDSGPEAN